MRTTQKARVCTFSAGTEKYLPVSNWIGGRRGEGKRSDDKLGANEIMQRGDTDRAKVKKKKKKKKLWCEMCEDTKEIIFPERKKKKTCAWAIMP
jgi:hypothetical protein